MFCICICIVHLNTYLYIYFKIYVNIILIYHNSLILNNAQSNISVPEIFKYYKIFDDYFLCRFR